MNHPIKLIQNGLGTSVSQSGMPSIPEQRRPEELRIDPDVAATAMEQAGLIDYGVQNVDRAAGPILPPAEMILKSQVDGPDNLSSQESNYGLAA
jgi:hypothetical protein